MSFNFIPFEAFFANTAFASLFLGMLMYWIQIGFVWQKAKVASFFMGLANIALVAFLVLRWYDSGHFPLSNLYESLLFLSWSLTTLHFVIELTFKQPLLSAITAPMALFTNAFAAFSLPADMKVRRPVSTGFTVELVNDACNSNDSKLCCFNWRLSNGDCFFNFSPQFA